MYVLEEKGLSGGRAEAISAIRHSRTGMKNTPAGVAIGRYRIVNSDRRFEIVSNRRDRDSVSENDILG
jgi:hypothetical protein